MSEAHNIRIHGYIPKCQSIFSVNNRARLNSGESEEFLKARTTIITMGLRLVRGPTGSSPLSNTSDSTAGSLGEEHVIHPAMVADMIIIPILLPGLVVLSPWSSSLHYVLDSGLREDVEVKQG